MNRLILIGAASVFAITGCRGDDLSGSETLSEIGAAGYDRLCEEARAQVIDMYSSSLMTQFVCVADSINKSSTASECATLVDDCRNNPPASAIALLDEVLGQAGCEAVTIEPSGCDLSVSRVDDCLSAIESEIDRVQFTGTCAAAGEPTDDGWWMIEIPAVCTSIDSAC